MFLACIYFIFHTHPSWKPSLQKPYPLEPTCIPHHIPYPLSHANMPITVKMLPPPPTPCPPPSYPHSASQVSVCCRSRCSQDPHLGQGAVGRRLCLRRHPVRQTPASVRRTHGEGRPDIHPHPRVHCQVGYYKLCLGRLRLCVG